MDYSQLIESLVEGLLKDATSLFNPEEVKRLGGPEMYSRERLVSMPIRQFLDLASELKAEHPEKKDRLEKALNSGEKIYEVPHLSFDLEGELAKVTGHEGRHRAHALLRRGFETMPVKLHARDSSKGTIRWSRENEPEYGGKVKVWPTELQAQGKKLRVPFPVKREEAHLPYKVPEAVVESIADELTEIVKADLGFGEPVSFNIRSGALFGDIIKKARAEGQQAGLLAADRLNVVPIGGGGGTLSGAIPFDTDKGPDVLPPTIYASVPHKSTGGIPAAKQTIAHEVGHWLNRDVEPKEKPKKWEKVKKEVVGPQQQIEKEVKAISTSREFASRAGIEMDPEIDQMNLNTYRKGVMRSVPISDRARALDAARTDKDTDENIAVIQNKFDVGEKEHKFETGHRRVVSGNKLFLNPTTHKVHQILRAQLSRSD